MLQQWRLSQMRSCLKTFEGDFPGGSVVKNLPANAGDMGSIPGQGGTHMLWSKLRLWATAIEPNSRACAPQQETPQQWEASAPQWESSPLWLQLEKAHTQQRRPSTAKNKNKFWGSLNEGTVWLLWEGKMNNTELWVLLQHLFRVQAWWTASGSMIIP